MFKQALTLLAIFVTSSVLLAAPRNLILVNGTGETADWIDLEDSTIDLSVALLGLTPNDFLVTGATGIAVNSGSHDLYFYDLPSLTPSGSLFLGNNRNPWTGEWLHDDTLVITNWLTSTISKIDVPGRAVITEHAVGNGAQSINHPQGIAIVGRKAYIAMSCFNDEYIYFPGKIEVFNLDANLTEKRLGVGLNPQDIRIGYDGYLYAVCTGNYVDVFGKLYRIDPATDTVLDSLDIGGQPVNLAVTRQGVAYLAAGGWKPWPRDDRESGWGWASFNHSAAMGRPDSGLVYTVDLVSWTVLHGPGNPILTDYGVLTVKTISDSTIISCNFQDDTITELDSAGTILARFHTGDGPTAVGKYPACYIMRGDANGSGVINIADVVYLIGYSFGGGSPPVSRMAGDSDCNGLTNIADIVYTIAYMFGGGPPPNCCAD
ncbi:MAG: hypothetical protein KAT58_05170 [candidate division Zixibacteria bacterium]|nr:hypothetical protein [candidate division Zixibacteria bacterium]